MVPDLIYFSVQDVNLGKFADRDMISIGKCYAIYAFGWKGGLIKGEHLLTNIL